MEVRRTDRRRVGPAPVSGEWAAVADALPGTVRLGTSSWSFPGWTGSVYDREATATHLARNGLAAYAVNPLLRAVGIDRTYYAPITAEAFAEYRAARTFVYDTARRMSLTATGQRLDADATKLFTSQVAKRAADAAMQVLGGNGYMGEYVVQRLWRDAKLLEIGGGTLEAHHKNITKDLSRDPSILGG